MISLSQHVEGVGFLELCLKLRIEASILTLRVQSTYNYRVCRISILGVVIMVLGRCLS